MKLYKAKIKPESNFITPLFGDTIFGSLCLVLRETLGEERLNLLLSNFESEKVPFLSVSSAFKSGFLPKPTAPFELLGEDKKERKENKKRIWLTREAFAKGEFSSALDGEKSEGEMAFHNCVDRATFSAGSEGGEVYVLREFLPPESDIYLCFDESRLAENELKKALILLGKAGFGKKNSSGKGRFSVESFEAFSFEKPELKEDEVAAFVALSPFVLHANLGVKEAFYEPFTRFGKRLGEQFVKTPVLMANTGALLVFKEKSGECERTCVRANLGSEKECEVNLCGENLRLGEALVHQGKAILAPTKVKKQRLENDKKE